MVAQSPRQALTAMKHSEPFFLFIFHLYMFRYFQLGLSHFFMFDLSILSIPNFQLTRKASNFTIYILQVISIFLSTLTIPPMPLNLPPPFSTCPATSPS